MQIAPRDYFDNNYLADFKVFGNDAMCGFSLVDALRGPRRGRFSGLAEFIVCQFNLNLLNQAIHAHAGSFSHTWAMFSAPFADTHKCWLGHGLGNHLPYSILRFAQQPVPSSGVAPVQLSREIVAGFTAFFFEEYLTRFTSSEEGAGFRRQDLVDAVGNDHDCIACVMSHDGWETMHVREFIDRRA